MPLNASNRNVINIEGEAKASEQFNTHDSLIDMLLDENRIDIFTPTSPARANIIGSGARLPSKTVVPEPSTLTLLGLGLAGLSFVIRKRS